ncbi:MAG TPA: fused MFS/spermidine synthase [Nitrosospira sp.]|nr:fused MFS/spermidine synthase [Nitrosospira sp.]
MGEFSKWRSRRAVEEPGIQVSEQGGVRMLHLGSSSVQSAMRLTAPNDLELDYTRCMMAFLPFYPQLRNILMIGLGGGSLAKFVYNRLQQVKTTVIEINPEVVAAARDYFLLPADNERLRVIVAEGGAFVASHPAWADVLMVDGFEDGSQAPSLCSREFYDDAYAALNQKGILVVNLLSRERVTKNCLKRIESSFGCSMARMTAKPHGNLIVFAFKHRFGRSGWEEAESRAKKLETELALPFPEYVRQLHQGKSF